MPEKFVYNYVTDRPVAVEFDGDKVWVSLADGRVLGTPLNRHPWLASATPEQRGNFELDPFAVYWPDLDDGLDIEWMRRESETGHVKIGTMSIKFTADLLEDLEVIKIEEIPNRGERIGQGDSSPLTKFPTLTFKVIRTPLGYAPELDYSTSDTLMREKRVS